MGSITKNIMPVLFLLLTLNLEATNKADIYRAYVTGDMKTWKNVIDRMNSEKLTTPEAVAELLNYQYGYLGWCIGNKNNEEAKKYLDLAEQNLDILSGYEKYSSTVYAYKAAFYGYRIAMNGMLAPVLGFKSRDCAEEALRLDNKNVFAWVQKGNIDFYTPALFGGSKKEALKYFLKAEELMAKNPESIDENWNYLNVLILVAQTYSYLDDYQSSKNYLDKILEIAPDFIWIKNEMYPKIEVKIKS